MVNSFFKQKLFEELSSFHTAIRYLNTSTLIYQTVPSKGDAFFQSQLKKWVVIQTSATYYTYIANGIITLKLNSHLTLEHTAQSHFSQINSLLYAVHQQPTRHVVLPDKRATKQVLWVRSVGNAERRENCQLSTTGSLWFHCYSLYKRKISIRQLQRK